MFGYDPGLTVEQYLRYIAWLRGLPRWQAQREAEERAAAVGLGDMGRVRLKKLSGGMIRRLGLAAATVGHPSIVLLDEPTAGLDLAQRANFYSLVRTWYQDCPEAVIIVSTHLLDDVRQLADRVLFLNDGVAAALMSFDELVAAAGETSLEQWVLGHFGAGPGGQGDR